MFTEVDLFEACERRAARISKIKPGTFAEVWSCVTKYLEDQIANCKATCIAGFFQLVYKVTAKDARSGTRLLLPTFILSETFIRTYNLKVVKQTASNEIPPVEVNYFLIAQKAALKKEVVTAVLKNVMIRLGELMAAGKQLSFDFRIGKLFADKNIVSFQFANQYLTPLDYWSRPSTSLSEKSKSSNPPETVLVNPRAETVQGFYSNSNSSQQQVNDSQQLNDQKRQEIEDWMSTTTEDFQRPKTGHNNSSSSSGSKNTIVKTPNAARQYSDCNAWGNTPPQKPPHTPNVLMLEISEDHVPMPNEYGRVVAVDEFAQHLHSSHSTKRTSCNNRENSSLDSQNRIYSTSRKHRRASLPSTPLSSYRYPSELTNGNTQQQHNRSLDTNLPEYLRGNQRDSPTIERLFSPLLKRTLTPLSASSQRKLQQPQPTENPTNSIGRDTGNSQPKAAKLPNIEHSKRTDNENIGSFTISNGCNGNVQYNNSGSQLSDRSDSTSLALISSGSPILQPNTKSPITKAKHQQRAIAQATAMQESIQRAEQNIRQHLEEREREIDYHRKLVSVIKEEKRRKLEAKRRQQAAMSDYLQKQCDQKEQRQKEAKKEDQRAYEQHTVVLQDKDAEEVIQQKKSLLDALRQQMQDSKHRKIETKEKERQLERDIINRSQQEYEQAQLLARQHQRETGNKLLDAWSTQILLRERNAYKQKSGSAMSGSGGFASQQNSQSSSLVSSANHYVI